MMMSLTQDKDESGKMMSPLSDNVNPLRFISCEGLIKIDVISPDMASVIDSDIFPIMIPFALRTVLPMRSVIGSSIPFPSDILLFIDISFILFSLVERRSDFRKRGL